MLCGSVSQAAVVSLSGEEDLQLAVGAAASFQINKITSRRRRWSQPRPVSTLAACSGGGGSGSTFQRGPSLNNGAGGDRRPPRF
ncbi:hypothetical protein AAHA92_28222 [Salvia divinorum]|uniref:Uncharacterized protein n=1 Tax=Salvia divinorum TaxID=28513 RepID=A0ABD1FVC9_SALDI